MHYLCFWHVMYLVLGPRLRNLGHSSRACAAFLRRDMGHISMAIGLAYIDLGVCCGISGDITGRLALINSQINRGC
jgi:hypothetical protein